MGTGVRYVSSRYSCTRCSVSSTIGGWSAVAWVGTGCGAGAGGRVQSVRWTAAADSGPVAGGGRWKSPPPVVPVAPVAPDAEAPGLVGSPGAPPVHPAASTSRRQAASAVAAGARLRPGFRMGPECTDARRYREGPVAADGVWECPHARPTLGFDAPLSGLFGAERGRCEVLRAVRSPARPCLRAVRRRPPRGRPVLPGLRGARRTRTGLPGHERKLVTVLFADVVESTGLGERLDPERLQRGARRLLRAMRGEIEAEGGTVEKFIGDAVMAVFGVPAAHEDDAARALRAALRMRAGSRASTGPRRNARAWTLAMRIGVNTGEVFAVTAPRPGEGMVTGDAVNVAARLEQTAERGQIVVAERTARAARGLAPAAARSARAEGEGGDRPGLRAPRRAPPCRSRGPGSRRAAGRPRPRARPAGGGVPPGRGRGPPVARDRVRRRRRRQVPAGRGVRRARREVAPRAAGRRPGPVPAVRRRRDLLAAGGDPQALAGVLDSDPPSVALDKVREASARFRRRRAAGRDSGGDGRRRWRSPSGCARPDSALAARRPPTVAAEVFDAWRSFFSALAAGRPAIVIVEDIHWADAALLDLLEELAEHVAGPVLFVCPSRPELTARRPGWGGGRWNFSACCSSRSRRRRGGLIRSAARRGGALGARSRADPRTRGREPVLPGGDRAAPGRGRASVAAEARWRPRPTRSTSSIPDTVQGVLSARMDLLRPLEKRVLQVASVVGRVFWSGAVARLLGPTTSATRPSRPRRAGGTRAWSPRG